MKIHKKKSYSGRWLLKTLEAGLVLAVVFFTIETLNNAIVPSETADVVFETTEYEIVPQAEVVFTAEDYFYMGLEDQISGDYRDAISDYTRAVAENPALAPAWLNRGVAHEQMGNQGLAHRDFLRWASRDNVMTIRTQSPIADGDSFELEMSANVVYEIPFYAEPGQMLSVDVTSVIENDVDPLIVVLDGYGMPIASGDDILRDDASIISADARIVNEEIEGGNCFGAHAYTLMITHAGGDAYGTLQVDFSLD